MLLGKSVCTVSCFIYSLLAKAWLPWSRTAFPYRWWDLLLGESPPKQSLALTRGTAQQTPGDEPAWPIRQSSRDRPTPVPPGPGTPQESRTATPCLGIFATGRHTSVEEQVAGRPGCLRQPAEHCVAVVMKLSGGMGKALP